MGKKQSEIIINSSLANEKFSQETQFSHQERYKSLNTRFKNMERAFRKHKNVVSLRTISLYKYATI